MTFLSTQVNHFFIHTPCATYSFSFGWAHSQNFFCSEKTVKNCVRQSASKLLKTDAHCSRSGFEGTRRQEKRKEYPFHLCVIACLQPERIDHVTEIIVRRETRMILMFQRMLSCAVHSQTPIVFASFSVLLTISHGSYSLSCSRVRE